jgi:hypothetical protein
MNKAIRNGLAAFALGATALSGLVAGPAFADRWDHNRNHWHDYDYDRPDPHMRGYYPERYYHRGPAVVVTRDTRVYRGGDGRYYCRRSDGTTGVIAGAVIGGVVGNSLDRGRSGVLGTLLGAGAGAAIGSSIDRGNVTCR